MSVTSSQEEIKFPHPLGHVTKYIKFQLPFKALEMSDTWELDNTVWEYYKVSSVWLQTE